MKRLSADEFDVEMRKTIFWAVWRTKYLNWIIIPWQKITFRKYQQIARRRAHGESLREREILKNFYRGKKIPLGMLDLPRPLVPMVPSEGSSILTERFIQARTR